MAKHTIEVFVSMNESGAVGIGTVEEDAAGMLLDNEGGYRMRTVKLTITMAAPEITEHSVNVPDEAGETSEIEASAT